MLSVLTNRTYRHLFAAQVIALVGTGLATVALGLLAYETAEGDAGAVLGTALAIKMVAYIAIAPVVGAYADRLPRKALLVTMDVVRAVVAMALPFVDAVWQIYLLIFLLQSASAAFTPTFQATIPDILPNEEEYTTALSLSRLAYDLESLFSPILAAALLTVISFHWLFAGTSVGFVISAMLVVSSVLPHREAAKPIVESVWSKTTRGARIYLKTPRLIGLLTVTLAAAAGSAMVIVNTVVIVKGMGRSQEDVALALAAYGGGSMLAALMLPRVLRSISDRSVMITGAFSLAATLSVFATMTLGAAGEIAWPFLLVGWLVLGVTFSLSVTPGGRLLRRSSNEGDRPALFAAQFALSHVCWLVAYPVAGLIGASSGMGGAFLALAAIAAIGATSALWRWPKIDPGQIAHEHPELPSDHPHVIEHGGRGHSHDFVIDELHRNWPGRV
ncbi:MFS transporter [Qipengyuania citrea]|jgi:MFS family permease|uniref:MFS transporter n=1 Tax=Qipengyuania citrea TaxID=225971 RepID=UPI000C51962D|nr:MFS transporter [Qipengyuania citrea]MBM07754.1 MFS transporter [Sulfitobacter sp.]MCD1590873.1 MFS transporter [Qipengyuania citrea]HBC14319.1 MFS transporter [Erythrobacter sp.]|tara:strand:- start:1003 stop:2337 length:1335 start_codon:yes stop_codon:yes gene_type:complete